MGPSPYLYVWAGDADRREGDQDFLIVVDADPTSATIGDVVGTEPVGSTGNGPHHAEPVAPRDGLLFANGFSGDRTFLFDLTSPARPVLAGELEVPPEYNFLHSFLRMENGHVLTTAQEGGRDNPATVGGLVEFDANGGFVQAGSAADAEYHTIRPYAIDLFPEIDRVLSSSFSMTLERSDNLVQLWRLSDLTLLSTVPVPEIDPASTPACYFEDFIEGEDCTADRVPGHDRTFEIRRLTDDFAILNTMACGFYGVSGLETGTLEIEVLMNWPDVVGCGVPTVVGAYYIMPVFSTGRITSIDVSDPRRPVIAAHVEVDERYEPHWAQVDPGTNRFVLTGDGPSGSLVQLYQVDLETGEMTLDAAFGALDMGRDRWPHGATGPAVPHAALFGR
ncbi:MAG: hypothetical protein ACC682_16180 [Gemmatimonadota bacterium]